MKISELRLIWDRILIEPVKVEEKTKGGIFIPDQAKEKPEKKAKKTPPSTVEAPLETEKKIRSKPRRRELKRQGLWVPKNQRGKQGQEMTAEKDAFSLDKPKIAGEKMTSTEKGKPIATP